jgi:hypothetical protein
MPVPTHFLFFSFFPLYHLHYPSFSSKKKKGPHAPQSPNGTSEEIPPSAPKQEQMERTTANTNTIFLSRNGAPYLSYGPILFFSNGTPICQLVKAPLLGTPSLPRAAHLPSLNAQQHHALAAVEKLARQYSHQLSRHQGDIQLVHNLSVMHARSAYRSSSSSSTKSASSRHLLRMFLRDPAYAWEKPCCSRSSFDDPFEKGRPQNLPVYDMDPWRIISGRESHG